MLGLWVLLQARNPSLVRFFGCFKRKISCPVKKTIVPFPNVYYMLMDEHGHVMKKSIPITKMSIGEAVQNLDFYLTISYIIYTLRISVEFWIQSRNRRSNVRGALDNNGPLAQLAEQLTLNQ